MQRFYAFVQTRTGDLGEQLVENGLARAHPATARPEGLTAAAAEWQKLIKLEHNAQREKLGRWGANGNRMAVRAQQSETEKGVDRFDKFSIPRGSYHCKPQRRRPPLRCLYRLQRIHFPSRPGFPPKRGSILTRHRRPSLRIFHELVLLLSSGSSKHVRLRAQMICNK